LTTALQHNREGTTPKHRKMADKDLMWALKTGDMDEVESKLVTVRQL